MADKVMKDKPTREQGLAFVETQAPTAFYDGIGDVPVRSDSRTHLEAVLGRGGIPTVWELKHLVSEDAASSRRHRGDASQVWVRPNAELDAIEAKRDAFLDYLQGCVDTLRPEGHGTCGTCDSRDVAGMVGPLCLNIKDEGFRLEIRLDLLPESFGCRFWSAKGGDTQ